MIYVEKHSGQEGNFMFRFNSDHQSSFYDHESVWDELIPADSVYRLFREFAPVLIKPEDFAELYCDNNGRPSNEVLRMTMACMLQQMLNETDRGMEVLTQVNIEIKYALFMALNERGIDHANFHVHRERMMKKQLDVIYLDRFTRLMYYLGVLTGKEPFLTDTTHSVAPISVPTSIELIRQAMWLILRWLSKQHKSEWEKLSCWPLAARYLFELKETKEYKLAEKEKGQRFHEVVREAEDLLAFLEQQPRFWEKDATLVNRALVLSRILHERVIENEDGTQKVAKKRGFKDIIVSAIDIEARFGAKGSTKWRGYKVATVVVGNTGFIAAADTLKANEYDGHSLGKLAQNTPVDQVEEPKFIGDSHYGSADNRIKMAEQNIQLVAPLIGVKALEKVNEGFSINHDHTILTCPMNQTFSHYRRLENRRFFLLERGKCKKCPRSPLCFNGKNKKEVVIDDNFEILLKADKYNKTEEFREDIKLRARIEAKQNELANVYGLRRIRYIGQRKLAFASRMKALGANFRLLNRLMNKVDNLKLHFYDKFRITLGGTA